MARPGPEPGSRLPPLTASEQDVLLALCRPLLARDNMFTEPASTRAIAEEIVITLIGAVYEAANAEPALAAGQRT